jgi:pimeloyl-ACP methyl ester carboxylesterase/uncharacterized protein YndB with AHSA1/START domain
MTSVVVTTVIRAEPGPVFRALTAPRELERWIAASASVDLREHGIVDFGWRRGGPMGIRAIEQDKLLEYTWQYGDEPETVVRWELTDLGGSTQVTVVQSGFDQVSIRHRYREGWTRRVAQLAEVVNDPDGVPVVHVSPDADIVPDAEEAPDRISTAEVDGRAIRYRRGGRGVPTVVLISGVAGDHTHFAPVFERLTRRSTVIAYDRSGYGGSDPTTVGADGLRWRVDELDGLLRSLHVPSPYLLAGHGLGALIGELYALDHPDHVAALVSINGDDGLPPPDLDVIPELPPAEEQKVIEAMFRNLPEETKSQFLARSPVCRAAADAEMADLPAGLERLHEASASGRLPRVPFVHIGVIPTFDGPPDLLPQPMDVVRDKLRAKHRRTASAYTTGEYVEANTGPFVQFDAPDLVCEVIERLLVVT